MLTRRGLGFSLLALVLVTNSAIAQAQQGAIPSLIKPADAAARMDAEQARETDAYTLGVQTVLWGMQWVKAAQTLHAGATPLPQGREHGIELVNLNRSRVVEVKVTRPLVLETLRIAQEAYEADRIINLPNMKVHYATGITLALKNMKGILVGNEKKHFHEVGLDKAIVDLNNTIKPCLNIVDGISCMEGMGPRGGDMVNLGLILAGGVAAEVDYVGSLIMGYTLPEVKHLELYLATNHVDLNQVDVVGERIEEVRYPFKKVNLVKILPEKFQVHNKNACSSCENAFLLSCQLLERKPSRRIEVYMGELIEESISVEGIRIAFGNCCHSEMGFDKTIKGCPPYPFALKDYLQSIGVA